MDNGSLQVLHRKGQTSSCRLNQCPEVMKKANLVTAQGKLSHALCMQAVAGKQTPKTDFYSPFRRHDNNMSIKTLINLALCAPGPGLAIWELL